MKRPWIGIGVLVLLLAVGFFFYGGRVFSRAGGDDSVQMSEVVLFGLGLTVFLFAVLAVVFSLLKLEDYRMPLGLPDGSVRALLAFSLVLIFVCLATYLYSQTNRDTCQNCGKTMALVTDAQLTDLKANFIVASELAQNKDGKVIYEQTTGPDGKPQDDLKHPLYNVSYYPKPNAAAADLAKQIFTTLATIFVSVVSFYFGSSVTTSAVRAAKDPGTDKLQAALTAALAESHNAQAVADQAAAKLQQAEADQKNSPGDQTKIDAVQKARDALNKANADLLDKQKKVQDAQKAINDAKGQGGTPSQS